MIWKLANAKQFCPPLLALILGCVTSANASAAEPEPILGERLRNTSYSRDGKYLAVTYNEEPKITLFDTATWMVVHTFETKKRDLVFHTLFSADGGTLYASTYGGVIRMWDIATGKPGVDLDARAGYASALAISPDGKTLVSLHTIQADESSTVHFWDGATGKSKRILSSEDGNVSRIAYSPDGKTLATTCYATEPLRRVDKGFTGVIERSVETGKEIRRVAQPKLKEEAIGSAGYVGYLPDGKRLILGGQEFVRTSRAGGPVFQSLWVLDRESGKVLKTLAESEDDCAAQGLSPDGKGLYVIHRSEPIQIVEFGKIGEKRVHELRRWNTETWKVEWTVRSGFGQSLMHAVPSPDGKRIAVTELNMLRLLDAKTGELRGRLIEAPGRK